MKRASAVLLAGISVFLGPTHAQVLASANPVVTTWEVSQFGMPADAKYVFCRGADCSVRSVKHLATPPQTATRPRVLSEVITPMATQASSAAPVEIQKPLVLTETTVTKPSKKRTHRRRPRVEIECKPVAKKVPGKSTSHPHARPSSGN